MGYSLNDTIVIFDRIREMRPQYARDDLAPLINQAVNDTLTRTLATNFCTLVMVTPFLFLGTEVIRDFTFAIFLGVFFGTYSTIYVASTMILATEKAQLWTVTASLARKVSRMTTCSAEEGPRLSTTIE